MSYADGLLSTGERVLHRERQHWFVLVWNAKYAFLALIVGGVLFFLTRGLSIDGVGGAIRTVIGWATLAIVVGSLVWIVWSVFRWQSQEYVITNRRVIQAEGVINKKATDSSLEKINDAVLTQNWIGRIFGFGDLDILTASDVGVDRLRMLVDATDFKKAMLEAKYDHERELNAPMPSAPLRVATPGESSGAGPAAAPSPAPAAAPTPARAMSAEDVTDTLRRLADLRDRGAISAAEYEAKKAELLGRL
ncbi:MAG: PH domain-containing protein [Chloroflexota bacterium]|nr:PH domain-containing protein [Chloroflexota bacterium]